MEKSGKDEPAGPPEVPADMEKEASLLEEFMKMPSISGVQCAATDGKGMNLLVHWSQPNVSENSRQRFVTTLHVADTSRLGTLGAASPPMQTVDTIMTSLSPTGQRMLIVKKGTGDADGAVLELWEGLRVKKRIVVPKSQHGSVYNDGCFAAGASWTADESRVAYIAEGPAAEQTPEWGGCGPKGTAGPKGWRGQGRWEPSWGEQKEDFKQPSLFILDLKDETVTQAGGLPKDSSCGFPTWSPDDDGLVVVVWPHRAPNFTQTAARLGFVYCMNRPSELHYIKWPEQEGIGSIRLTPSTLAATTPAFSPDGYTMVFLSHSCAAESGVHNATVKLCAIDWPKEPIKSSPGEHHVVVDAVQHPETGKHFPGLYPAPSGLLHEPFIDKDTLLIGSQWGFQTVILSVNIRSGAVQKVSPDLDVSWHLLSMKRGLIVASVEGFTTS